MDKIIKQILFFLLIFSDYIIAQSIHEFSKSFINSYDLSGRYNHEYHPFILEKTKESYLKLEDFLCRSNFKIRGHKLIFGYQEDSIPPYQTSWFRQAIEDEVIVKNHAGLCLPTKNIFGFMTGFLLKDGQWLEKTWFNKVRNIEHILSRPLQIFDDFALIFQKHAFGKDFENIIKIRDLIERAIYSQDMQKILKKLISFWSYLYENSSRTGSEEIIGSQDILFSIAYAQTITESKIKSEKLFLGPDITYPIEILACQKKRSTAHAQVFVERFMQDLVPIENENTAYIFLSFVDGVGKSTLLNNIKNYQKFGKEIEKYIHCDNSSTQEASTYQIKDKVFLVDLPAQMSHFVTKPDGSVFVDIRTNKSFTPELKQKLINYVSDNKEELFSSFIQLREQVKKENKLLYSYDCPIKNYAYNCNLFNLKAVRWIPFRFEENYYLFEENNIANLRILVPLSNVHSIGLKVVEPEQMLFDKGLSLAMPYDLFLADLKEKLDKLNIKNIVFVDFLSMYPRSSRENIRINFILQYLRKIFNGLYDLESTFYKHNVHKEQEICYALCTKLDSVCSMLAMETALRYALYKILNENVLNLKNYIEPHILEPMLEQLSHDIIKNNSNWLEKEIEQRLLVERELYYAKFGLDKTYQNIICFSFEPVYLYSKIIASLCSKFTNNTYFNTLWNGFDAIKEINSKDVKDQQSLKLADNLTVSVLYKVHELCKEENDLRALIRTLRAQWYAILANFLNSSFYESTYIFDTISYYVPPILVVRSNDSNAYVIQKSLPLSDVSKLKLKPQLKFHLIDQPGRTRSWGNFADIPHCLNWDNPGTFFGIYAFGYYPFKFPKSIITKIVDDYKKACLKDGNSNFGIPAIELFKVITENNLWKELKKEVTKDKKEDSIELNDMRLPGIRLWVRAIATLEMILKDPKAEILVRKGNKEDFIATLKLLEHITLPQYFGINLKEPLFQNYEVVEPLIPWEYIK